MQPTERWFGTKGSCKRRSAQVSGLDAMIETVLCFQQSPRTPLTQLSLPSGDQAALHLSLSTNCRHLANLLATRYTSFHILNHHHFAL